MKKIYFAFLLSALVGLSNTTKCQNFLWAKGFEGNLSDFGYGITTDNQGNVLTTGIFRGTVDFDPSASITNLSSNILGDVFVSKLDAAGNFLWAKSWGDASYTDNGYSIATDAAGNVYTTGMFGGTVDFDPGAGTYFLSSVVGFSAFISKLDAAGNFIWAKQFSGNQFSAGYSIRIDSLGNILTTGYFEDTTDFDPDTTTYFLVSADGGDDIFISKLDSSGNFIWAKRMGGTGYDYGNAITTDAACNYFITGSFRGTADFDPDTSVFNLTSSGNDDVFVAKLDSAGNFKWVVEAGSNNSDIAYAITNDATGDIYATGYFRDTATFGTDTLISTGLNDIFIWKLDSSGNSLWTKQIGGIDNDNSYSIAKDLTGQIYLTGAFNDAVDFNPDAGTFNLTSVAHDDIFVLALNLSGSFAWAKQMGGQFYDFGYGIAVDLSGNVFTTGDFENTVDFNPDTGVYNLISLGSVEDIFVQKLGKTTVDIVENIPVNSFNIFPVPTSTSISISFSLSKQEQVTIKVFDVYGRCTKTLVNKLMPEGQNKIEWNLTNESSGIYLLDITVDGARTVRKIVKQ